VVAELESLLSVVDAVVIAAPSATHAQLAMDCLDAGKHVLVEKPLATDVASACAVIERAEATRKTLLVGHLTLCHPALLELRRVLASGVIGTVQRIEVTRTSNGARHRRDSALWSLGPHDIANVLFATQSAAARVREAWADSHDDAGIELELDSGALARMTWSRSATNSERRLAIEGSAGTLLFDETGGALQLQRAGIARELTPDCGGPSLLERQCAQFVREIVDPTAAQLGLALQVVRILAAAQARLDRQVPEQKLRAAV